MKGLLERLAGNFGRRVPDSRPHRFIQWNVWATGGNAPAGMRIGIHVYQRYRQTDRQTDRQIDAYMDGYIDRTIVGEGSVY